MLSLWFNIFRAFGAMARNEPKIIVDCGFEHALTTQDILLTSKQIVRSFGENRRHCMPFVMHLCNLQPNVRQFGNPNSLEEINKNVSISNG